LRRLSVCLIVRNQAERLEGMVGEVIALAAHLRWCVADVVVVDDASTDETPVLLARLGRRHPGVKILNWPDDTDQGRQVLDAAYALCEGAWVLLGQARAGQSWCVSGHPRR
jgi:glycosyltransferase involved in cell wall biosynthesis